MKRLTIRCEALGLTAADTLRRRLHAADPATESDPRGDPTDHAAAEVAGALAETKYRSSCRLHLVRRLSTELPRVWQLVTAGRLDVYSAEQIHAELQAVADRSKIPALEEKIVHHRRRRRPRQRVRAGRDQPDPHPQAGRRLVAAAPPADTDEKFRRAYADRAVRTEADDIAGMGQLWLSHSVDRISAIKHRLTMIARTLPADDPRSTDQQVADLACDLLQGRITVDTCTSLLEDGAPATIRPTGVKRSIQLNITVPVQTVMGLSDTPGETYTPTTEQKRATYVRDRTCVGVGCNHPADSCDVDHTQSWGRGGATRGGNLGPGCRTHHNSKDNGGPFRLAQPEPGLFRWTYPSGHTYTTTAEPYPHATWSTSQEFAIPASATDVAEGLQLLAIKREREARKRHWYAHRSLIETKLARWRRETGEAFEEPDPECTDDHSSSPSTSSRAGSPDHRRAGRAPVAQSASSHEDVATTPPPEVLTCHV